MKIFAFPGIRYQAPADEAGSLAAPPYDQIDDRRRDRFHRQDRRHFTHLSRPVDPDGGAPAAWAARLHERWLREGVLQRDAEPAVYPYELQMASGGKRLGLFALVGLEAPETGVIRPHEETITKTVEERLELLRATGADLGPVLLLSEDAGTLEPLLEQDIATRDHLARHQDEYGHHHLLYRVTESERVEAYRSALSSAAGLIADGHHRYKTARLYAQESGAEPDTAAGAKLTVITSLTSPALAIEPIHRALRQRLDPDQLQTGVVEKIDWNGSGGAALAAAVATARQPAIGVATAESVQIWTLDPQAGPTDLPPAASQLAVVLLHRTLLEQWGLGAQTATDGTVLYRSDPDDLQKMIDTGEAKTGFWLPPMSAEGFAAAIAKGDVLPPKSTRFMPKIVSGLVWSGHDSPIE